jgi:endo-1,4-beta-xylanase
VLVEVKDTTKPVVAPTTSLGMLWPPDHRLVPVTIDARASDNDGAPTLVATVTSNEADNGLGDGDTAGDIQGMVVDQTTGLVTMQLRAERSGRSAGRVYTVTVTATDRSGNISITSLTVLVPRSKGQGGN